MTTTSYAGLGRRVGADVIDSLIVMVLLVAGYAALIVGILGASGSLMIVGLVVIFLVAFAYPVWLIWHQGATGGTPGKRMLGIRTVDEETGAPIGFGRALLRQLVLGLLGPINLVQLFVIPHHPLRQGWHDRAARSVVVPVGTAVRPAVAASPLSKTPAARNGPKSPPPLAPPTGAASLATGTPPGIRSPVRDAATPAPVGMVPPPPGISAAPPAASPPVQEAVPSPEQTAVDGAQVVGAAPLVGSGVITPPPGVPVAVGWLLAAESGQQRPLNGQVLVGRDPDPGLVEGAGAWHVDDPDLSVSKTHALFGVDGGNPWVEDWHSTNGVVLEREGERRALSPHDRTDLRSGDVVRLGELSIAVKADA